jgi:hypothetical protein
LCVCLLFICLMADGIEERFFILFFFEKRKEV